jgi:YVTN family beta-propeller protein
MRPASAALDKNTDRKRAGINTAGVAITPDGSRAYITNAGSMSMSVIDTATNTVTATVVVGVNSLGIAISPVAKKDRPAKWKAAARQQRPRWLQSSQALCESSFEHAFAPKLASPGALRPASDRRSGASLLQ